ncbi:MAG: hypothetical protein HFE45_12215 [Oscillospiraceae bacterium]|jgi:uncharacterized membrane protein|nr:hypothetical protein [Oscillospiraceae bacterium]
MMNSKAIKRTVALAAAFTLGLTLLLAGVPARAAGGKLSATAKAATGSLEQGGDQSVQVDFVHSSWSGELPTEAIITAKGTGGLSGEPSVKTVTITATENKVDNDSSSNSGNGGTQTTDANIAVPKADTDTTYTLVFSAVFSGFSYNGSQNAGLTLDVDYGKGEKFSAVAPVESTKTPSEPDDSGPVTPSKPTGSLIGIKSGTTLPEIKAGETKTISIPLVNSGSSSRYAGKTQVTAELPDGLYFNSATAMWELNFSRISKEQTLKLPLIASDDVKSGVYPITIKSVFKYGGQQIDETLQLNIKITGKEEEEEGKGALAVKNYRLSTDKVKAGQSLTLVTTVENTGDAAVKDIRMVLNGLATEGFTINNGMDTQIIPELRAGGTADITWSLLSSTEMVTGNHSLTAEVTAGELSASSKIFIPVEGKPADSSDEEKPKSSRPRVVIDSYTFAPLNDAGEPDGAASSVEGGKTFRLTLNLKNTSAATAIENLKMTISSAPDETTGGVFTPANSSNTFFIAKVGAGETFTEIIDLLVKADAPPKSYGLQVEVSYEAVLDKERINIDDNETITIPVTQPDRFEVGEVNIWSVMFGDSLNPSVSYVNKGKSSIYNLSIAIEGSNFTTAESTTYVGNVESGSGDYYEASLNPEAPGTVEGKFILTYEDAAGNPHEVERAFSTTVEEMNNGGDDFIDPGLDPAGPIEPVSQGMPGWAWVLIGVGAVAVVGVAVVVILKIKKKRAVRKQDLEDDYDD